MAARRAIIERKISDLENNRSENEHLQTLYKQIKITLKNKINYIQFMNTLYNSLLHDTAQYFKGFPCINLFKKFYALLLNLVNEEDQVHPHLRSITIKDNLGLPNVFKYILKYDYYFCAALQFIDIGLTDIYDIFRVDDFIFVSNESHLVILKGNQQVTFELPDVQMHSLYIGKIVRYADNKFAITRSIMHNDDDLFSVILLLDFSTSSQVYYTVEDRISIYDIAVLNSEHLLIETDEKT